MSNMIIAKMKLDDDIEYVPWEPNSYSLYILEMFLSVEIGGSFVFDELYYWINNPSINYLGGNITSLKKINKNILIILDFDDENYEIDPKKYSLTISCDQLLSILHQWQWVIKNKPPFIIITEDNGIYTVTASRE